MGLLLFLGTFVLVGWPMIERRAATHRLFHAALIGLTEDRLSGIDLESPLYSLGGDGTQKDRFMTITVNAETYRKYGQDTDLRYKVRTAEYYFDVFGPLRALLFFDAGQAYLENQRMNLKDMRISYGVEARFIMPVLNVPFRLIYYFNPNRSLRDAGFVSDKGFKFAVGTTF